MNFDIYCPHERIMHVKLAKQFWDIFVRLLSAVSVTCYVPLYRIRKPVRLFFLYCMHFALAKRVAQV